MFYRNNIGTGQRWARFLAGAATVAAALTQIGFTPLGLGLAAAGVVMVMTGAVGFCPACAMVGIKGPK